MRWRRPAVFALALSVATGVAETPVWALGSSVPKTGSIVPNTTFRLSPSTTIALEKIVGWGLYLGVAYLILDPLAPNWEIEAAPLADNHVHFTLKMKRFYNGGAGEARMLFHRRAKEIVRLNEFDGYRVLEYSESLESSVLGSRRLAEGVVQLTRKGG
jgi:hypothetical protein